LFADFDKIFAHVEEQWRRNTIEFAFLTGWRSGRVRGLLWSQIEDDLTEIRASADVNTKKAPGNLPLSGRLLEIIQDQAKLRIPACGLVFHRAGKPIGSYRKAWYSACGKAGYGKILPHDFRRSLARNLTRAGVAVPVVMKRAGWKTMSTFLRYNIADLRSGTGQQHHRSSTDSLTVSCQFLSPSRQLANTLFLALPISLIHCVIRKDISIASTLLVVFTENNMKLRDRRLTGQGQGSIAGQEIIRARAVTAELKLNI
jgi:hypothetical protein